MEVRPSVEFATLMAVVSLDSNVACPTSQLAKNVLAESASQPSQSLSAIFSALSESYNAQDESLKMELDQCKIAFDKLRGELHRVEAQIAQIETKRKELANSKHLCGCALAAMAADATLAHASAVSSGVSQQKPATMGGQTVPSASAPTPPHTFGKQQQLQLSSNQTFGEPSSEVAPPPRPPMQSPQQLDPAARPAANNSFQQQPYNRPPAPAPTAVAPQSSAAAPLREIEATLNLLRLPEVKETMLVHALSQCDSCCLANRESPWMSRGEYEINLQLALVLIHHLPRPRPPVQVIEVRILASIVQRCSSQALPPRGGPTDEFVTVHELFLGEDGFATFVKLLDSVNDEVKNESLHALAKITADSAMRDAFRAARGVPPLMNIVATSTSEAVLERALCLLWTVAPSDAVKADVRECGGLRACIDLLYTDSISLLENNVIALVFLTRETESAVELGTNGGGLEKIVATLHHPNCDIQSKAAAIAWNCASVDANRVAFRHLGAIPVLIELLSSPNETCQENAAGALWNLTVEPHADNRAAIFEYGGLSALVQLLASKRPAIVDNAAGTLWNLSSNVDCRAAIRKCGGIKPLLLLLYGAEATQEKAAGTLRNCALNDQNKSAIREAGGIEIIIERLPTTTLSIVDKLMSTLWMATVVPENKHAVRTSGGFAVLAGLLSSAPISLLEKIFAVFRNCSTVAENRSPMIEAGIISGIASAVEGCPTRTVALCESAAATVWNLSREDKVSARVQGGLGLVCSFIEAIDADTVLEQAAGAISSLTISSPENKDFVRESGALYALRSRVVSSSRHHGGAPHHQAGAKAAAAMFALQNMLIALRNCTSGCEVNQKVLIEAGFIEALLEMIKAHSSASAGGRSSSGGTAGGSPDDIAREAILCLKNIASDRRGAEEVVRANGLSLMTLLAESGATESIRKAAVMALQGLSRSAPPSARR